MRTLEEEEEVTVSPQLVSEVRDRLIRYVGEIYRVYVDKLVKPKNLKVNRLNPCKNPKSYVVVDGGSNILSLNVGFIGICTSVAVYFEGDSVLGKFVAKPLIVPENPEHLPEYSERKMVEDVLAGEREALVLRNAVEALEKWRPELVIIDGPLLPPVELLSPVNPGYPLTVKEAVKKAREQYKSSYKSLFKVADREDVSLVGFVKRPRSKLLAEMGVVNGRQYDHILLMDVLSPGEYYPAPPLRYGDLGVKKVRHGLGLGEQIELENLEITFTFLKTSPVRPPFRVDIGVERIPHEQILWLLYSTATSTGVPYGVMKADEETKMGEKLLRELHGDALHTFVDRLVENGKQVENLVLLLGTYGEAF